MIVMGMRLIGFGGTGKPGAYLTQRATIPILGPNGMAAF